MEKITALLIFTLPLAACVTTTKDITECPGSNGIDVIIKYGDSYMTVTHMVSVEQDEKIVLKLKPEMNAASGTNYQDLEIELAGKKRKDKWLDRKLRASDSNSKKAVICVDGQAIGEYEYDVIVPGVGNIDPRVDVKN